MSDLIKKITKELKKLEFEYIIETKINNKSTQIIIKEKQALPLRYIELIIKSNFDQYTLTLYKIMSENTPPVKLLFLREGGAIDDNTLFKVIKETFEGIIKNPKPGYYPC